MCEFVMKLLWHMHFTCASGQASGFVIKLFSYLILVQQTKRYKGFKRDRKLEKKRVFFLLVLSSVNLWVKKLESIDKANQFFSLMDASLYKLAEPLIG